MITEDYVSFETAKLLKEKGFDLPVNYVYHYWTNAPFFHRKMKNFNGEEYRNLKNEWYSAPTQSLAMKWLREVHNIHIEIRYNRYSNTYHYKIIYGPTELDDYVSKPHVLRTYEEAAEESIKYCLEMLVK